MPILLCGNDVTSVVISYLKPWCLANFFVEYGLDFGMKFIYDARGYVLKSEEINLIFSMFPGVVLVGLSFYDVKNVSFAVRLDKVMFCEMRRCVGEMYLPYQLGEISGMNDIIGLKLIDYCGESDLSRLCRYGNLQKLVIERINCLSSPYVRGISECEKLVSLKLINIKLVEEDMKEISRCRKLVRLRIDGRMRRGNMRLECENLHVLKLRYYDGYSFSILGCPNVRRVRLENCVNLRDVDGLGGGLEFLEIVGCPSLDLRKYISLKNVRVILKN